MVSMSESLIWEVMAPGWGSLSLKSFSMKEISVAVVSRPQKAHQSFTTIPAPITSEPRLTVPAAMGTCQGKIRGELRNGDWGIVLYGGKASDAQLSDKRGRTKVHKWKWSREREAMGKEKGKKAV